MENQTLEYSAAPPPKPPRTRWWLVVLLVCVTPFLIFGMGLLLAYLGYLGPE